MNVAEKKIFEDVLANTGFSIVSNNEGLYKLSHKNSDTTDFVQTSGYNLLESLRRLTSSSVAKGILS